MSYLPTYPVNVGNWSSRHRGKIIGLHQTPFQIGPLLMSVIYYSFFANNQKVNVEKEDLRGFFVCMAGILGFFTVLALILTRDYEYIETDEDREHLNLMETDSREAKPSDESGESKQKQKYTSFCSGIKHLDIQFMFWAQAVTPVAGLTMLTTITPMLNSFGYINLSYAYTTSGPFVVLISKLIITYLSDKYIHKVSRMTFSLILSIGSAIFHFFAIFYGDNLAVLTIVFLVSITAGGISFGMIPTALTERFDNSIFGIIYTLGCLIASLTNAFMQPIAGHLYDMNTVDEQCYGFHCFQMVFVFQFCLQMAGTTLHIFSLLAT